MIQNRIIRGILEDFQKDFEIESYDDTKAFEYLVNYLILAKTHEEAVDGIETLRDIDVDKKGGNFGIDGFILFINDIYVPNVESIEQFLNTGKLDVKFVFIQSKTSSGIDTGELLKATKAIKNVFSSEPSIPLTDEMKAIKEIIDKMYQRDIVYKFTSDSPTCELYYVTTSGANSTDSKDVDGIVKSEEEAISDKISDLKNVEIKILNANHIIDLHKECTNRYEVDINFKNSLSFEKIKSVDQSYIGYLLIQEFIKLLTSSDGTLRRNLFYENVRDFQGDTNNINIDIANTIDDPNLQDKFVILNNGVTIVAKQMTSLGSNDYRLSDYYIVNGCQTSSVIFNNKDKIKEDLWVPIKIINTKSDELITKIIKATNKQTPVPDEAFVALEKFHKLLQDFYNYYTSQIKFKLYYERRSKEYLNGEETVPKAKVINLHSQIRNYTAVILGEPQLVISNNPSSILKEHNNKLFQEEHSLQLYFVSSLFLHKFINLITRGRIANQYYDFRYHICWIARILYFENLSINQKVDKKIEIKVDKLVEVLLDDNKLLEILNKAIVILNESKKEILSKETEKNKKQLERLKSFKEMIVQKCLQHLNNTSKLTKPQKTVFKIVKKTDKIVQK